MFPYQHDLMSPKLLISASSEYKRLFLNHLGWNHYDAIYPLFYRAFNHLLDISYQYFASFLFNITGYHYIPHAISIFHMLSILCHN